MKAHFSIFYDRLIPELIDRGQIWENLVKTTGLRAISLDLHCRRMAGGRTSVCAHACACRGQDVE